MVLDVNIAGTYTGIHPAGICDFQPMHCSLACCNRIIFRFVVWHRFVTCCS